MLDVAFGVDGNHVPHLAGVLASITRSTPKARFRFIVLYHNVSDERRAKVESVAPGSDFLWIAIEPGDMPPFVARGHFSAAVLYRLGLEKLAPQDCRRLIYLDADLTVLGDLRELWAFDLNGAPLGAVFDPGVDAAAFAAQWGLAPGPQCFNSGVLLMDLEQVRAQRIFSDALEFFAHHGDTLCFADQDALNYVLWGRMRFLPARWNVQRCMLLLADQMPPDIGPQVQRPAIVHFTGSAKPWIRDAYHPWAWLYWRSLASTPFHAEVASKSGIGVTERFWLRLRWLKRKPKA